MTTIDARELTQRSANDDGTNNYTKMEILGNFMDSEQVERPDPVELLEYNTELLIKRFEWEPSNCFLEQTDILWAEVKDRIRAGRFK